MLHFDQDCDACQMGTCEGHVVMGDGNSIYDICFARRNNNNCTRCSCVYYDYKMCHRMDGLTPNKNGECEEYEKDESKIRYLTDDEFSELMFFRKRIVFLNTSIITKYGRYTFIHASLDEIKEFVRYADCEIVSAIGHKSTAKIMSELLAPCLECLEIPRDEYIKVNRIEYKQEVGDVAIVFKMNGRPPEGKILTKEEIEEIGYSWGFLTKYK